MLGGVDVILAQAFSKLNSQIEVSSLQLVECHVFNFLLFAGTLLQCCLCWLVSFRCIAVGAFIVVMCVDTNAVILQCAHILCVAI